MLWPNYYENDKELLDKDYKVTKEYNITNLGWSAWLANNQPYIVLVKKVTEFNGDGLTHTENTNSIKSKPKKK